LVGGVRKRKRKPTATTTDLPQLRGGKRKLKPLTTDLPSADLTLPTTSTHGGKRKHKPTATTTDLPSADLTLPATITPVASASTSPSRRQRICLPPKHHFELVLRETPL
jgi:hypothetical protein